MSVGEIKDWEFEEFKQLLSVGAHVKIYTDGSCLGNPGPGGWGCVLISENNRSTLSGFEKNTTNNRMELLAAIRALESVPEGASVTIYTDSSYVKNGITVWIANWKKNNWTLSNGKPVKNKDLWCKLSDTIHGRDIRWEWVKGHADCEDNNSADFLARSAIVSSYMEE